MKKLFLVLPLAVLIGCAGVKTATEGAKIDKDKVLTIKPGATTRQMVIEAFGTPSNIRYENNEERMVYIFKEKKTPGYFGGLVENEMASTKSTSTLELTLKDNIVWSYKFKSQEE